MQATIRLTTDRLLLRPLAPGDLDAVAALHADPAVMGIRANSVQSRAESTALLRDILAHWQAHGFGAWAVLDRRSDSFLGECGLRRTGAGAEAELSYGLAPHHWGQGLATEAADAVLRDGFERIGLDRVIAVAHARNQRSRRVLQKLGMRLEAVWPESGPDTGPVPEPDTGLELARYAVDRAAFLAREGATPAEPGHGRKEAVRREREARLAQALRANLRRRKVQDRARGTGKQEH